MSILKCNTLLTIKNCTGLEIHLSIKPESSTTHMRVQPDGNTNITGAIESKAFNVGSWLKEWVHLVAYGPTHRQVEWVIQSNSSASARFNMNGPFQIELKWSDPSVSWADMKPGIWSLDITNVYEIKMFVRADLGNYIQKRHVSGPSTVQSVHLKLDMEIACDDSLPFSRLQTPIANMFWRKDINLQNIVNPSEGHT